MTRLAVLALAVAGCWTNAPAARPVEPPPDPQPAVSLRPHPMRSPCEVAVDHVIDISREEFDRVVDFAEKLQAIRDASVDSCNETHWSPELLRCFDDTIDSTSLSQCQSMLSADQTSDLMKRITEVLTQPVPPPTP